MRRIGLFSSLRGSCFLLMRLVQALICCIIVVQPAKADDPVEFELSNGLRVVLVPSTLPEALLMLRVNVGFLDEQSNSDPSRDEAGMSHELEHALFQGTRTHPSARQFDEALTALGGQYNASTTAVRTNYFMVLPAERLEDGVELHAQMFTEPLLNSRHLRNEARPIAEELMRDQVNPISTLLEMSLALHGHIPRMRKPLAGTPEGTLQHDPKAIREFFNKHYSAKNMTLAVIAPIGLMGLSLEDVYALLDEHYGQIKSFDVPAPVTATLTRPAHPQRMFRVRSESSSTRALNISFSMPASNPNAEAIIRLLSIYLGRRGVGSVMQPMYDRGLVREFALGSETYRNLRVFRLIADLTPEGENKIGDVMEFVGSVLGALKRQELNEQVMNELKETYQRAILSRRGAIDHAEAMTDALFQGSSQGAVDEITRHFDVNSKDVRAFMKGIDLRSMELTLMTPDVADTAQDRFGQKVEAVPSRSLVQRALTGEAGTPAAADTLTNPFMESEESTMVRRPGVSVLVNASENAEGLEGVLHFNLSQAPMSQEQRVAANLAMLAFRLDPVNQRILNQVAEAGIGLGFGLDLDSRLFSIQIGGRTHGSERALHLLLNQLARYKPDQPALARARAEYVHTIRARHSADITNVALSQGVRSSEHGVSNNAAVSVPRIFIQTDREAETLERQAQAVDLSTVQQVLNLGRRRWGVTGVLRGNWSDSSVRETLRLIQPQIARRPEVPAHSAALAVRARPRLVVRTSAHDRQAVARFYPVAVKQYSNEHWAFLLFSKIVEKRMMQTARGERGLIYAGGAGFSVMAEGGAALYMVADTSHAPSKLAMVYTTVIEHLLATGVTEEEFSSAQEQVLDELEAVGSDIESLHSLVFEDLNPKRAHAYVQNELNAGSLIALIGKYLYGPEAMQPVDSAVIGQSQINERCRAALMPR